MIICVLGAVEKLYLEYNTLRCCVQRWRRHGGCWPRRRGPRARRGVGTTDSTVQSCGPMAWRGLSVTAAGEAGLVCSKRRPGSWSEWLEFRLCSEGAREFFHSKGLISMRLDQVNGNTPPELSVLAFVHGQGIHMRRLRRDGNHFYALQHTYAQDLCTLLSPPLLHQGRHSILFIPPYHHGLYRISLTDLLRRSTNSHA